MKKSLFVSMVLAFAFVMTACQKEDLPLEVPQCIEKKINKLKNKTVLVYRDGLFRGNEVKNFITRGEAMNTEFILVECIKSGTPRLYGLTKTSGDSSAGKVPYISLCEPPRGLSLKLSSTEAIVVTTQIDKKIGIPRPLRLKIRSEGKQAKIEDVIDTTLKLTLLHYGALKSPRLPIPLYGADKMAYLRLKGIYPSIMEGDRQFWL